MVKRTMARRYARAAFEIALEQKELDRWRADLAKLGLLVADAELVHLLEDTKFPFADKTRILSERLTGINPLALNLVYLLVSKGRLRMLGEIIEEYHRLLDEYRGIEHAEVVTAVPLAEEDRGKLAERLQQVSGKKVVVKAEVDVAIIGGFIARVGGKVLDGSVRSRLEALKREMAGPAG